MRFTGFFGILLLGTLGLIVADVWAHPGGTNAVGTALIATEKAGVQGISGQKVT
jgi:hypothetical protein